MVIHPRDTRFAYTAVLASRRLQKLARRARVPRIVQHPVVRVVSHLVRMVERVDVRLVITLCAKIQEHIWLWEKGECDKYVVPCKQMPDGRHKQRGACGDETEEEDYDDEVLFEHEVMAQTGTTVCDATIGELAIELAKRGGRVHDEKTVEEAYRRISCTFSTQITCVSNHSYLNEGSRPKKATNVTSEIVTVKMMMLRASDMVREVRYLTEADLRIAGTKSESKSGHSEDVQIAKDVSSEV
jgi:hypothetical protein